MTSECLMILHNRACGCWWCFFHMYHLHLYLGWSLKKFHEVWIQKVKWKDKLHACWNDLIKWTEPWVTNLILQSWPNDSRWTLQQRSWRVHVELVPRKCFICSKTLVWALSSCYFDQSEVWLWYQLWGLTLNKSCSFASVEQTLFKGPELVR